MKAQSEDRAEYFTRAKSQLCPDDDATIAQALRILEARMSRPMDSMASPQDARYYLRLHIGGREHEVFVALWLDAQNRLIAVDDLFRGTLTQTSVYPREVVKSALAHNAGAVILAHNHPSGLAEPSRADEIITGTLKTALALVDVKVLDHFIVTAAQIMSLAERGLL